MKKYKKYEVDLKEYEKIAKIQIENGSNLREHIHGSRRNLFSSGKLIATTSVTSNLELGELSQPQFVSFLGMFNKHLYTRFSKYPWLFDINVDFKGVAREKNISFWHSLKKGTYFYNIDLSSAYWQIAHKLGYIDSKFFESYQSVNTYKQAKRYCISFLARKSKVVYKTKDSLYEINCDNSVLQKIYDNVRNELYRCVNEAKNSATNYLEYNIDGVTVLSEDIKNVCEKFKSLNLQYKIIECQKISDYDYSYKNKMRVFTKRNLITQEI